MERALVMDPQSPLLNACAVAVQAVSTGYGTGKGSRGGLERRQVRTIRGSEFATVRSPGAWALGLTALRLGVLQ